MWPFRQQSRARIRLGQLQWKLYHADRVLECFIAARGPVGIEIRFYYEGQLCQDYLHRTRADAQNEAHQKRQELLALGWRDAAQSHVELSSAGAAGHLCRDDNRGHAHAPRHSRDGAVNGIDG
jgi:hypothetical protein